MSNRARMSLLSLVGLVLIGACATANGEAPLGEQPASGVDGGLIIDDAPDGGSEPGDIDASADADAAPPMLQVAPHIVLSEVALSPTEAEFIEVYNGTNETIALGDAYISDAPDYFLLPGQTGAGPSPSVSSYDFVARFPGGASIDVGAVAIIAMDGDEFTNNYGVTPDYCLRGSSCDQLLLLAGSSGATLTNAGEPIVLFQWDGAEDLVTDIDMVLTGEPTAANPMPNKSGVLVDGPDSGTTQTSYHHDSLAMSYYTAAPGAGTSLKRHAPESGESAGSSNGIDGHDETSEDLTASWGAPPFTAPTPGAVPSSLTTPQ